MTNLEFYKDEIKKILKHNGFIGDSAYQVYVKHYGYRSRNSEEWLLDWLLEEHKEPIKLTQWEKDMLEIRKNLGCTLENNLYFCELKNKGYFKNVDLSKTAEDILGNCEVVENVD